MHYFKVCIYRYALEPIITVRHYGSAAYDVIVCPSVCLSVTSRSSTKMAKPRITQTTPYDSPGTLSFLMQKISANFQRSHPKRGAK